MFKRLLIPLDGSHLAETALSAASKLAQKLGASVTLIHVIERDAPKEVHKDRHLTEPGEAQAYLEEVARRTLPASIQVEKHVHVEEVKDVARSIVEHTHELEPDLVIMCTHGSGGPRDWFLGSIAQQVIAMGKTPVLLIPAKGSIDELFPCQQVLVPLDGMPDHEQGLPVATNFARICGVALHLLMVIPTRDTLRGEKVATGKMLPGAMAAMLDLAEQGGKDYLGRRLADLQSEQIQATAEVARGDPAALIADRVKRVNAGLIVLGTHGKTGMEAFWSGSVAPRVSSKSRVPLLLVPVQGTTEMEG